MHVAVLPGDGIGPEVAAEAIRVLDALGIEHSEHPFGGNAILDRGTPLPDETLAACRESDAVLLAAVGLPKLEGKPVRPEQGLLGIRKELRVYANLRPAVAEGIDLIVVRELVGDSTRREEHARRRDMVRHVRVLAAGGRADRPARLRDRART